MCKNEYNDACAGVCIKESRESVHISIFKENNINTFTNTCTQDQHVVEEITLREWPWMIIPLFLFVFFVWFMFFICTGYTSIKEYSKEKKEEREFFNRPRFRR